MNLVLALLALAGRAPRWHNAIHPRVGDRLAQMLVLVQGQ